MCHETSIASRSSREIVKPSGLGSGRVHGANTAHLAERDVDVVVLERGEGPAAAVLEWGHVRLFSAWPELTDAAARRLLEPTGWTAPISGYPTGAEWVSEYLAPLAGVLGDKVKYATTVTGISRQGRDKVVDGGRKSQPFVVHAVDQDGNESRLSARAIIDASGTWGIPNPAGSDGFPALGESKASASISYRIPDDVTEFAGSHVVVVGAGHSATHAVLRLSELARRSPGTRVHGCCVAGAPRTSSVVGSAMNSRSVPRSALAPAR